MQNKVQIKVSGKTVECVQGDITNQPDMKVIVNAANAQLRPGGGVAGAIHRAAGPALDRECRPLSPINPGEAVITQGHKLLNPFIIHCLGPIYSKDKPEDKLLANCYRNALNLAEKNNLDAIAFPAISTGVFGYPQQEAVKVVLGTISELLPQLKVVKIIRFVLFSETDFTIYAQECASLEA